MKTWPALDKISKEGFPFIALFALLTVVLGTLWSVLWGVGLFATLWCVYFFRDPERVTPEGDGLVVSAADGKVLPITQKPPPSELNVEGEDWQCVSVFMNVLNVHVNRMPLTGSVVTMMYRPGKFFNASFDKSSEANERHSLVVETDDTTKIVVVQIAGLIARRIVCKVNIHDRLRCGERFGLIRFGSRVDVYIPKGYTLDVKEGQTVVAGETILARKVP